MGLLGGLMIPLMLLFGMLRPLGSLIGALSQSLGRSDIEFGWNLRICGITLLVTVIGAYSGSLEVMAIALAVSQVLSTVLSYYFFSSKIISIGLECVRTSICEISASSVLCRRCWGVRSSAPRPSLPRSDSISAKRAAS